MSKESGNINRRSILKGIGATGVAAIGSAGLGVAKRRVRGTPAVLKSASVQALLDEIGNPSVDTDNAEKVVPKIEDEERPNLMTTTVIPTEIGDVHHVSTENNSFAYLVCMNESGKSKADSNKIRKAVGAPANVPLMVMAQKRDVTVSRGVTPREEALLARETDFDIQSESTHALKTSAVDGFRVVEEEPSSAEVNAASKNEVPNYYNVTVSESGDSSLTVTNTEKFDLSNDVSPTAGDVSTSDCNTCNSCTAWCVACIGSIGTGCGPCSYALYTVGTGPGAAIYISCALIACAIVAPITCNNCIHCSPYV
ncbi:hypothetical protein [Haladaptatus caseinilyticus]|uniref:hypothetical protein n=1 Tax=Haladaptatus caseinilyticus TaxID=2993314 RepID=UPI00224A4B79|nr:hypothetical protein [Haladaptatus caseinilyticus]